MARVRHLTLVPALAPDDAAVPDPLPRVGTAGRLLLTFAAMGLLGWASVAIVSHVFS